MSNNVEQIMLEEKHAPSCLCEGIWTLSANHSDVVFHPYCISSEPFCSVLSKAACSYVLRLLRRLFCLCTCYFVSDDLAVAIPEHRRNATKRFISYYRISFYNYVHLLSLI